VANTGRRRQLLKNLRFHRLLAAVERVEDPLRLRISGPASVLAQASRYGLQLACFLPAVTALRSWRVRARIPGARGAADAILALSEADGLRADNRFLGYRPEELHTLADKLHARAPDLRLHEDGELLILPGGEAVVPDLRLERADGSAVRIELFHRWHRHALARRLDQLAAGAAPDLVLGVDRGLARLAEAEALLDGEVATARCFLFSGYPSLTAVRRLAATGGR